MPPRIGLRVREKGKVVELSRGVNMTIEPSAFAQLYKGNKAADGLNPEDRDLYFKILTASVGKNSKWALTVMDSRKKQIGRIRGSGSPPPSVNWSKVVKRVLKPGDYTYFVDLSVSGQVFRGNPNEFEVSKPYEKTLNLANFQVSTVAGFQSAGGQSISGSAGWTPMYRLSKYFGIRGNISVLAFNKVGGGLFFAGNYQLLGALYLGGGPLSFEFGGGAQTWVSFGGTSLNASGNFVLSRGPGFTLLDKLQIIDRIWAGYTMIFATNQVHIASAGVGIKL